MNRPETTEGMPLMASTKIRTGRRSLDRVSFKKMAVITPKGREITRAMPTCSMVPDDGVQAAAGRGRLASG